MIEQFDFFRSMKLSEYGIKAIDPRINVSRDCFVLYNYYAKKLTKLPLEFSLSLGILFTGKRRSTEDDNK